MAGWIYFVMARPGGELLADFFAVLGRPELATDPRFASDQERAANAAILAGVLDEVFASQPLAVWRDRFAGFRGCWGPMLEAGELHEHPQVEPNGFINEHTSNSGFSLRLVAPPMQFAEQPTRPAGPAPEVGQHSELVLLEHGYEWDDISRLQDAGVIGPL
jgi:formyl-CoA transferase